MAENNLFDMMKTYLDNEDDNYVESNESNYLRLFSNPLIQTSFSRFNLLKKIIIRKENLTLIHFFDKLRKFSLSFPYEEERIRSLQSIKPKHETLSSIRTKEEEVHSVYDNSHLIKNKKVIEAFCNEADQEEEIEVMTSYEDNKERTRLNPKSLLSLTLKNILHNKIRNSFHSFISHMSVYNKSKKLTNSNLSLIYIFTELAIAKMKLKDIKGTEGTSNTSNMKLKIQEYERKLSKYESSLNEKMEIIANKNDKIEMLNDHIEELNSKIKKLETKQRNFNIIEESLCAKCGSSLEESIIHDNQLHQDNIAELKGIVQEQLEYITKMEKENKELKHKNSESKQRNETIMAELEIIKSEFNNFTQTYNLKKEISSKEMSTQTDIETKPSSAKKKIQSNSKSQTSTKKFATKLNLTNRSNTNSTNSSVTNYNIINISNEDTLQNLKFDNSILTQEIMSLNKELNRLKTETKFFNESMKKFEKEKGELTSKLIAKTEGYNKLKKENEELMILIQTSNYKSFVQSELENKKLARENSLLSNQIESLRSSLSNKERVINEIQSEYEKLKKDMEGATKFKTERENLVLENSKLESEIKRLRYDTEEMKNLLERQNILLKNKEEQITKLNEELSYMAFNSKKAKQEAERSVQDAIAYQQILRKMEKDLSEAQLRKEKAENDLQAFKNFISKKG